MSGNKITRGEKMYDYIITGAGCAGLSLAVHMINSGRFDDKRILIIDKEEKNKNDRTWCFWETQTGLFDSIVYRKWENVWFYGEKYSKLLSLKPYNYKLIRGIDFYNYCIEAIKGQPNFSIKYGNIKGIRSEKKESYVEISEERFYADYIFNSILFDKPVLNKKEHYLLQHFKGWVIETEKPVFNADEATLMDFRPDQQFGTAFVYVMPFSSTRALVEYTLFTREVLQPQQYDEALKQYIGERLEAGLFTILEEELGIIPMTDHKFPSHGDNIINIGTAGGRTKPSSGYTFQFIQKHSAAIVEQLLTSGNPFSIKKEAGRFRFYDSVLLSILSGNKLPGKKIFTSLFKKNKPQAVLRFLDNESSLRDELKIISSLPTLPFLNAALKIVQ